MKINLKNIILKTILLESQSEDIVMWELKKLKIEIPSEIKNSFLNRFGT